ncbi:572_t:CDS:2, partial [Acaulospora colombiana]
APSKPSEAAVRLKQAEAAQEAEDNEKIQLKDSVDARIQNWKGGKEANLRALIASLDTVLWPELGWVKVGMHELVTPSQVKIRYTKAIAKVHPDKLKTGNTTVEQRMLANGVFAGLNEAWGSFKP